MADAMSNAVAASYAYRTTVHDAISQRGPFPFPDDYGAQLLHWFAVLPPQLAKPLPPGLEATIHRAYFLGLGVLAERFIERHRPLPPGTRALDYRLLATQAPRPFERAAQPALHELMARPADPSALTEPYGRRAFAMLGDVHAELVRLSEAAARRFIGLAPLGAMAETIYPAEVGRYRTSVVDSRTGCSPVDFPVVGTDRRERPLSGVTRRRAVSRAMCPKRTEGKDEDLRR
jgi:hypothetical protein